MHDTTTHADVCLQLRTLSALTTVQLEAPAGKGSGIAGTERSV
jgi:hypothetical protein